MDIYGSSSVNGMFRRGRAPVCAATAACPVPGRRDCDRPAVVNSANKASCTADRRDSVGAKSERLHIQPNIEENATTRGAARRLTPVLMRGKQEMDVPSAPRQARLTISDEHYDHFASSLLRRMERYVEKNDTRSGHGDFVDGDPAHAASPQRIKRPAIPAQAARPAALGISSGSASKYGHNPGGSSSHHNADCGISDEAKLDALAGGTSTSSSASISGATSQRADSSSMGLRRQRDMMLADFPTPHLARREAPGVSSSSRSSSSRGMPGLFGLAAFEPAGAAAGTTSPGNDRAIPPPSPRMPHGRQHSDGDGRIKTQRPFLGSESCLTSLASIQRERLYH